MAEQSKIEWTDATFNPWIGCAKVAPGCLNCYAETYADRWGKAVWGPQGTRTRTTVTNWNKPLKWDQEAASSGTRRRVFCASLADVFEDWRGNMLDHHGIPTFKGDETATMDDVRADLFRLIDATPSLDWLLLTKRPQNVLACWNRVDNRPAGSPQRMRQNVWLGTSISDQATADELVPELLNLRALCPVLFLSVEPLLGPVDLRQWLGKWCIGGIDWVITGGESGHGARVMEIGWVRALRDQCVEVGVPFFFKQWGEFKVWQDRFAPDKVLYERVGKRVAGRILDGREWNEVPEVR